MNTAKQFISIIFLIFASQIIITVSQPVLACQHCNATNGNYTRGSSYRKNLETLLNMISSNTQIKNGFYKFSVGQDPDRVNGIALCRADHSPSDCQSLLKEATTMLLDDCPVQKEAIGYYFGGCMLRYSNRPIFDSLDNSLSCTVSESQQRITDHRKLKQSLADLLDELKHRTSAGNSSYKFSSDYVEVTTSYNVYGLAQCNPDLSSVECSDCLQEVISNLLNCCSTLNGAGTYGPVCSVEFANYPLIDSVNNASVQPIPPAGGSGERRIKSGNNRSSAYKKWIIVVGVMSFVLIAILLFGLSKKNKRKKQDKEKTHGGIKLVDSLQLDFDTIRSATDNFAEAKRLNNGNATAIYKVAASMKMDVNAQVPYYPNLPSKLLCILHNVTLHADPETDEVYAQMTLQPVSSFDKEALLRSDLTLKVHKPQTEFFCKTLTASDTSTHGGFSVPRRAAEKIFPPLDFSMQPPAQELVARDLHDNVWTFRHIYRGQPKRHLLTTGWSLFVSGKRLSAGDSVLFIRDEKQHLLLGTRRANRQPTNLSSSVLSSDSMHIGILAAAAHAAANNSPFTVFFNPRASPSEFVIPLAKYYKANYGQQVSLGMRFRMMFETEESATRRYMGTITGISDLDPRWKNSQWRNLQVGWDESTGGERRTRVSAWEIEPVTGPFFICPLPFLRPKRPWIPGMSDDDTDFDSVFKRTMPRLGDDSHASTGLSLVQWMNMQQNSSLTTNPMQSSFLNTLPALPPDLSRQLNFSASQPIPQQSCSLFNPQGQLQTIQRLDQLQKSSGGSSPLSPLLQSQQMLSDVQSQAFVQNLNSSQHPSSLQNHQFSANLSHILPQSQHSDTQMQMQLLQRLQHQQPLLSQLNNMNQVHDIPNFSRPLPPSQILDMPQTHIASPPRAQIISQQTTKSNSQANFQFSQPYQVAKIPSHQSGDFPDIQVQGGLTGDVTADIPSSSASPSAENCPNVVQTVTNSGVQRGNTIEEKINQSSENILNAGCLERMSSHNFTQDLHPKVDVKPSIDLAKVQSQGFLTRNTYQSLSSSQIDYLDSSSATSALVSQNDIINHQSNPLPNSHSVFLEDAGYDVHLGADISDHLETSLVSDAVLMKSIPDRNYSSNLSSGCMPRNYDNGKDAQELSSSMVTESFGVPDLAFNNMDSVISDGSFMNAGAWGAPPQYQRLRTYTKVYKRGAVGRSIDVTRYSDYDELKQDLARMFGLVGQMEDRGRVGWKLVYVDHENDVLLVGDDPWEDFVNCVRCIKILSPQEVQQMSLDGDFGNVSLPNQTCSSSDGGNV